MGKSKENEFILSYVVLYTCHPSSIHQLSIIIINHHQPSSPIINHPSSAIHHHPSSPTIITQPPTHHHHPPSPIIITHHQSPIHAVTLTTLICMYMLRVSPICKHGWQRSERRWYVHSSSPLYTHHHPIITHHHPLIIITPLITFNTESVQEEASYDGAY